MTETISLAVSKRPVVDEYAYPSVRLRVETDRSAAFAVRLVESLPSGVEETDVGFHADEGYEHWSVTDDGRLVYEDVVAEGDPATTLYGIADGDEDQLAACMTRPAVEVASTTDLATADWTPLEDDQFDVTVDDSALTDSAEPTAPEDETTTEEQGDEPTTPTDRVAVATRNGHDVSESPAADAAATTDGLTRGGSADVPAAVAASDGVPDPDAAADSDGAVQAAAEPEDDAAEGESDEPADATDETVEIEMEDQAVDTEDATEAETGDAPGVGSNTPTQPEPHDSVVEAFAAELRRDEPSSQAVATLRSHLAPDTAGSVDAKLDHCMTRIGELDAYVDALEEFLDEEGTAEQLLTDVRDDLRTVEAQVEDVEDQVESVETAQSRLDDRLAAVEEDLDAVADLDETVADLDDSVAEVDERVRENYVELTDAVADVEAELSALGEDVESVEQWRSAVVDALAVSSESDAESESESESDPAAEADAD